MSNEQVHEEPTDFEVVKTVAGLMIQAGLAIEPDGDRLTLPTRGWAPPPATGSPEVEYGAALAVQALVYAFDLDREQVQQLAAQLMS